MGSCYSSSSSSSSSSYSFSSSTEKSSSSESDDGNAKVEQPTTTAATSATSTTASHLWKKKKKKKKIMKMLMKNQKKKNKKKSSRENNKSSSGGLGLGIDESVLRNMQGRMSSNGATKTASLYTQQGKKGTNQDAMLVWENFNSRSDTVFCGVFDGHGPFGHTVAKRVRDTLPLILCSQWKAASASSNAIAGQIQSSPPPHTCTTTEKSPAGSPSSEETASPTMDDDAADHHSLDAEDNKILPEMCIPLKKSILEAFNLMDKELKLHPTIDCFCSGTTAVTLIKRGQDVVIANVGDSRAVLGTRDKDNSLVAIQLTVDLKPDLPREAARIQQCKGRVFALQDEPEVARVWLPNNDSPGLAMARAFGDFCLKDFGLISVPDIYYHQLTERDQFVILASDGIWDVLSNKEAVDIVASAPGHAMAARALVDCAIRAWRLKYPTSKTDDCAVVCLFFEHLHAENGAVEEENVKQIPYKSINRVVETRETASKLETDDDGFILKHSGTVRGCDEIVPVSDLTEENLSVKSQGHSKRSLAECISAAEDEEWSALEGITRVNSLLSIPRLFSSDKRTTSWRKWL